MNKIIFTFFLLINFEFFSQEGTTDTIFCTTSNTSYIIFPDKIDLVDIGNTGNFAGDIQENSVFVKSLIPSNEASTLLIKMGTEFFYFALVYRKDNKRFMYDYKKKPIKNDIKQNNNSLTNNKLETSVVKLIDNSLEGKVERFMKLKTELSTLGFTSDYIDAGVSVIRNDSDKTFLKMIIKNKSSIPYKLDFISFQYYQDQKKGLLTKSKMVATDVFPIYTPKQLEIKASSLNALCYVIPVFAMANNGYLMVTFRESMGDRTLKIKITSNYIQGSQQLSKK